MRPRDFLWLNHKSQRQSWDLSIPLKPMSLQCYTTNQIPINSLTTSCAGLHNKACSSLASNSVSDRSKHNYQSILLSVPEFTLNCFSVLNMTQWYPPKGSHWNRSVMWSSTMQRRPCFLLFLWSVNCLLCYDANLAALDHKSLSTFSYWITSVICWLQVDNP